MCKAVLAVALTWRFQLWALIGVGVLYFRFSWFNPKIADHFVWSLSYWMTLLVFVWFAYTIIKLVQGHLKTWVRSHWLALFSLAIVCGMIHVHEPHFLKVTADEPAHLCVSQFMHLNRQVGLPVNVSVPAEMLFIDSYSAPFRGHLFSFLLSLSHDFFGYHVESAYVINALLGYGFLCVLYMLGLEFVNKRILAFAIALLYASAPIFGQVMCSGSYDILNVLFIALLCLFLIRLTRRGSSGAEYLLASILAAVLLSYTRPESLIYYGLVVAALIYHYAITSGRNAIVSWFCILSPLLLLPAMATQVVLLSNPINLNQNYLSNTEVMLSFDHVVKNWMDTLVYFTNAARVNMSSVLLFILGLIFGCLLIVRFIRGLWRSGDVARLDGRITWVFLFSGLIMALYTMVMASFWGGANNPVMTRFTLPLWLMLALFCYAGLMVLGDYFSMRTAKPFAWIAVVYFYVFTLPVHSAQASKQLLYIGYTNHKASEWILSQNNDGVLYVASSSLSFLAHRVASINMKRLNDSPLSYSRLVKSGVIKRIILVELRLIHPVDGKTIVHEADWRAVADLWKGKRLWSYSGMLGMEIVAEELTGVSINGQYHDFSVKDVSLPVAPIFTEMQNGIIRKAVDGNY